MKLFAYACLAGSGSAQSGDYDDRGISSDYYDAVGSSSYYEYDEFGNKKKKNKNQWFDNGQKFGLETYSNTQTQVRPKTNYWDWATALNCWPANIEADQIVYANQLTASNLGRIEAGLADGGAKVGTDLYPTQQHHNRGPQHVFGSYEILDRAHEASNTSPKDTDLTDGANTGNRESNSSTAHVKNGYFAGHGEPSGTYDNLNLHQEDPVLRSGLGGLYQYGHDTWNSQSEKYHNEDMDNLDFSAHSSFTDTVAVTPSHWTHYKQARHAGCLYEKAEWHYGYGTYEQIFLATYFQGYGGFDLSGTTSDWTAAYDTGNSAGEYVEPYLFDDKQGTNKVEPIWWHFFNAHILPNPQNTNCQNNDANLYTNHLGIDDPNSTTAGITYACPTVPKGDLIPNTINQKEDFMTDYLHPELSNAIPLVMANPAYEGLGYLNFIVEYKNKDRDVGEDYLEFIDSTPAMDGADKYDGSANTTSGFRGKNTYREINNCNANDNVNNFKSGSASMASEQECTGWGENLGNWSGVHGMFYYDLYMGSWLVYPAVGSVDGASPIEHYRTWVSYPFKSDGTSVIFDPSSYTNNFNGDLVDWHMALYDFTANPGAIAQSDSGPNGAGTLNSGNGQWEITASTGTAGTVKWSADHDLVVSSFPHNNLGKDFRFNLRVLQGAMATDPATTESTSIASARHANFFTATKKGANQIYRSYYFYKINQIDIRFPYYVAYALHHENRGKDLLSTESRTTDGLPGTTDDFGGGDAANWSGGNAAAAATATEWCDNDAQCASAGQQWWNTLNNDIVHPLTYDENGELYRHMDTTVMKAFNRNDPLSVDELDDYQFMHVSLAHTRSNIIPPVDLGTHSPGVNKHNNSNNGGGEIEFHRIMGYIRNSDADKAANDGHVGSSATDKQKFNSADWCDTTGGYTVVDGTTLQGNMGDNTLERTCGFEFRIVGLMNTYDERRGQRGTYQEIWVQLQYALGRGGRDGILSSCGLNDRLDNGKANPRDDCATNYPVQSPHPYLHFMASEIISIEATCNTINVNNPNRCSMMTMGPGESNNAAYGGK